MKFKIKGIRIGKRTIGNGEKPFLMAEAGINHNGELEKAFQMIAVAKRAGADAIKFQTFKVSELVSDPDLTYTYQSQGKTATESMLSLFARYEFNRKEWVLIKKECDKQRIHFLSTPQNPSDLETLLDLGVDAIKVGSDDFTNIPYLKQCAQTKLPLILSCGMADLAEIHQSLEAVGSFDGYPTILLFCVSQYPVHCDDVNLLKLKTLTNIFSMIPIGFSDHTQGPLASSLAVAFGACIFEKHFTLDKDLPGPDHWFSEDPEGLSAWVTSIQTAYRMMGSPILRPTSGEIEMRTLARRSVVALSNIRKGEIFTNENIGLRRPGNGLPSLFFKKLIGQNAIRNISKGTLIQLKDCHLKV